MLKDKLKALRKARGLTQEEMAERSGIAQGSISAWETGRAVPKYERLQTLSAFFDVPINYLMGGGEKKTTTKIPILGYVAAGIPIEAITQIEGYEEITEKMALSGTYFALRVKGFSMSPRIMPDDVAIIRQQNDCDSGSLAIVQVANEAATMKFVRKTPIGIVLTAYNSSIYPPKFYSNEEINDMPVSVLGVVVEIRASKFSA